MLHITPEIMVASYELLRVCPPFRRWKLPPADAVKFKVALTPMWHGWFRNEDPPLIVISARSIGSLDMVTRVMAHEMVHFAQAIAGTARGAEHNADFYRRAALVCKSFCWDRKAF